MSCALCELPNEEWRLIDANAKAFASLNWEPLKPGHTMVMPRRHVGSFAELTADESKALFHLLGTVVTRIGQIFPEEAAIHANTGGHMSQPSHLHLHVLPSRYGLRELLVSAEQVPERRRATRAELEAIRAEFARVAEEV